MQQTYKNLIAVSADLHNQEIIEEYRQGNEDLAIASFFVNNFSFFKSLAHKYWSIEEEEKSSFALTAIHNALEQYNGDYKLITLAGELFKQKLINSIQRQNAEKREIDYNYDSLESMRDNDENLDFLPTYKDSLNRKNPFESTVSLFLLKDQIQADTTLSEKEKDICLLLSKDASLSYSEIGEKLNISKQCVYRHVKKLKNKSFLH